MCYRFATDYHGFTFSPITLNKRTIRDFFYSLLILRDFQVNFINKELFVEII